MHVPVIHVHVYMLRLLHKMTWKHYSNDDDKKKKKYVMLWVEVYMHILFA